MSVLTKEHKNKLALPYVFRLTENGRPHRIPDTSRTAYAARVAPDGVFVLPVAPQEFQPTQNARIALMHTRTGIIADEQGASPPEWNISGQMLLKSTKTGLGNYGNQRALEEFFEYYLTTNVSRGRVRQPLIKLIFHDFYGNQHWLVVPMLIPLGQRSSSNPTIEKYASIKISALHRADVITPPKTQAQIDLEADAKEILGAVSI